jgi:tetratricopeptide (TPR) repeat protein
MKTNKIFGVILVLVLMTLGVFAQSRDVDNQAAIKVYTNRIQADPKDSQAYFERGKVYRQVGDEDKAIADFTKTIELEPTLIKAYLERAKLYRETEKTMLADADEAKAATIFKQAKSNPQTANKYGDDELSYCPTPIVSDYSSVCNDITSDAEAPIKYIEKFNHLYEKKLWEMSCALPDKHTVKEAVPKIQRMWNKHKLDFKCDTKNVLKFALLQFKENFIGIIVENYELDINFKSDDGNNVLDFVNNIINERSKGGYTPSTWKKYKEHLIFLGAKPSR